MKRKRILIVLTLLVMGFIFFESSLPGALSDLQSDFIAQQLSDDASLSLIYWIRKAAHLAEYALLGALLYLLFRDLPLRKIPKDRTRAFLRGLIAFGAGVFYAAMDEIHQYFVPERSCELRDVGIDALGVLLGVIAVFLVSKRRKRRKNEMNGEENSSR